MLSPCSKDCVLPLKAQSLALTLPHSEPPDSGGNFPPLNLDLKGRPDEKFHPMLENGTAHVCGPVDLILYSLELVRRQQWDIRKVPLEVRVKTLQIVPFLGREVV